MNQDLPPYVTKIYTKDCSYHGLADISSFINETNNNAFKKGYILVFQNITQEKKEYTVILTYKLLR